MKINRFLALVLALAMLAQIAPGMAPAVYSAAPMTLTVGSAEAKPGDTVTLTVSLTRNSGFAGFTLRASYDKSALTLTKIEQGAVLNEVDAYGLSSNVSVGVANWASTSNCTGNGALMTLTFTVNKTAASGNHSVTLRIEDFFSVDGSGRFLDCPVQVTAGTVSVAAGQADSLLGDLNLDGEVDSEDLTLLARHVGGIASVEGEALGNCDVNGDGTVNSEDLTVHARYVGGIINEWP